jgi:hypothetical protein
LNFEVQRCPLGHLSPGTASTEPGGSNDLLDLLLRNLAGAHPLTRLQALHGIRLMFEAAFDTAELEQVRVARTWRPRPSWEEIGKAWGVTGQAASRKFRKRGMR